jgi:hypothetical protein
MNVREGMRRLAVVLGLSGFIVGCYASFGDAQALWSARSAHRKFESLMASPTMQKVAKAARDYQKDAWAKYRGMPAAEPAASAKDPWEEAAKQFMAEQTRQAAIASKFGGIPVENEGETRPQTATLGPWEKPSGFVLSVKLDGIEDVWLSATGLIAQIDLSSGEPVPRVDPPTLKAYLVPLLYPILGFLLPWGGIRVLTWVATGFREPRG